MPSNLSAVIEDLHSMGLAAVAVLPMQVTALVAFNAGWLLAGVVARGGRSVLQLADCRTN